MLTPVVLARKISLRDSFTAASNQICPPCVFNNLQTPPRTPSIPFAFVFMVLQNPFPATPFPAHRYKPPGGGYPQAPAFAFFSNLSPPALNYSNPNVLPSTSPAPPTSHRSPPRLGSRNATLHLRPHLSHVRLPRQQSPPGSQFHAGHLPTIRRS